MAASKHQEFKVTGMTCASCANSVSTFLSNLPGVEKVNVNYANTSATLDYNPDVIGAKDLIAEISKIGYGLVADEKEAGEAMSNRKRTLKIKVVVSVLFALPVFILGMFFMDWKYSGWISLFCSLPVVLYGGSEFFVVAWKQARHFRANMDTLVAIGTGVAFIFSVLVFLFPGVLGESLVGKHMYFESADVVIALVLLGRYLEERAKEATSSAIRELMGLQPKTARVVFGKEEKEIPVEQLMPGLLIRVFPGERLPVDGEVKEGNSYIDASMVTGEPVPVAVAPGSAVTGGTINQNGSLLVKATHTGQDTLLSGIIKMVKEAQGTKSSSQRLADKISSVFVPIVLLISVAAFLIWFFIGPEPQLNNALIIAVSILVVACPCALGLATPTAIMVGMGKAAKKGLLIRDAESLEKMHKTDVVMLDKTGTITKGTPEVVEWNFHEGMDNEKNQRVRSILKSIEQKSEHPLAKAIVRDLENVSSFPEISGFDTLTGKGARAEAEGLVYWLGNEKMAAEFGLKVNEKSEKGSMIFFGNANEVLGSVVLADQLKEGIKETIAGFYKKGLEVIMLTGDQESTAKEIAKQAGIKKYYASLMPGDKIRYIKEYQSAGKIVAMAGDGINDAPALAQADVGIAMGQGTDVAMGAAHAVIVKSDPARILDLISVSRLTVRTVKQNLFWAFIYNICAIPVAAGILYPFFKFLPDPMLAGAAMAFSSVSVVTNSLLLKRKRI